MKTFFAVFVFLGFGIAALAAEHALSIDKTHSRIEVQVGATTHEFTLKLSDYEADILTDTATGRLTQALLRFKFADLKTGDEKRDEAMLAWENNDQFPEVVFNLISIKTDPVGKGVARGQLILHGVAQEITLELTVTTKDQLAYTIDGQGTMDTQDFGLPILHRYGFIRVDPVVTLSFHLQGTVSGK